MRCSAEMWRSAVAVLVLVAGAACLDSATRVTGVNGEAGAGEPSGGSSVPAFVQGPPRAECASPRAGWIWCDDFEQDRLGSYFEYVSDNGSFARVSGVGLDGSPAMRARFQAGQTSAGNLKLAFGRTPSSYMRPVDSGANNYRDVFWRMYLKNAPGWTGGGGDKLSRATIFAGSNWSQAMIAHVWSGGSGNNYLVLDPASGTDTGGNLRTTGYNDFPNLRWFGATSGATPIFSGGAVGQWYCVEAHARLNDAGQSNGVFEMWIDDQLDARAANLNWVGAYAGYGINAIFIENFWNNGSPQAQERYVDNLVVSTQRIGCGDATPTTGTAPANLVAQSSSGSSSIQLAWTPGTGSDTQILERKYTSLDGSYTDANWARVRTALAGTATTEEDTGLQVGATYTYRVIGVSGGVESAPSNTAQAKVGDSSSSPVPTPVARVSVSPASAAIAVGATRQFTATLEDANGNTLSGRTVTWTSTNTTVAKIDATGFATGVGAGTATITASSEGKNDTATLTVGLPASTGLTATSASGSSSIQLAWTLGTTYDSQILERKYTSPDGSYTDANWTRVRTALGGAVTSETDASLQSGATYSYRVIGVKGGVESGPSNTAQAKVGTSTTAAVASVTVSPASASIAVGGTRQFSATVRDAQGNTLSGRAVTWSSSNAAAATVSSTGLVTGRDAGGATLTATSEGKSGTASVTVTSSSPGGGGGAPNLVEDFSTYSSTSVMRSDPRGIYHDAEDIPTGLAPVVLDASVGFGTSDRSMRYDWGAGHSTISRMLMVPNVTEIWVEWTHRFESGYSMQWGGGGDASYKFLHVEIDADNTGGGRFGHNFGNGDHGYSAIEPPNDIYDAGFARTNYSLASVADGKWHTYRYHVKLGNPDLHELWVDGVLKARKTGFDTRATRIWGVALGRNQNQTPARQSQWWGRVQLWWGGNDPGW